MSNKPLHSGATAALKGYRVQALYSIFSILSRSEEADFIPEGEEDLDILSSNGERELVQVKNLASPLTLSNIAATSGTSFIRRCLTHCSTGNKVKFKLVSFGPVGEELKVLFSINTSHAQFKKRLSKFSNDENALKYLKDNTEIVEFKEKELTQRVMDLVKGTSLNADPKITVEVLHAWIYLLAEKRQRTSRAQMFQKVAAIGKFITEREQFYSHFNITIRPFLSQDLSDSEKNELSKQFYQGIGARYAHILSNADVIRDSYLEDIHAKLNNSNVVIIHGASGQGKSTLAYRYIHDFHCAELAFTIELLENTEATLRQIEALHSLAKSLNSPLLLYIDVLPGNFQWVRIIKEFSHSLLLRFLLTVREEDWNRTPGKHIDFSYDTVSLTFRKTEAEPIYDKLISVKPDLKYTSFDEAWHAFGENGPLLEFTYLITQGSSLQSRLNEQIFSISDDARREILRIICFCDSMGAKVNARLLAENHPGVQQTINSFEREFLVKYLDDGASLAGLHPVRSKIITNFLIDEFLFHSHEYVLKSLTVIQESDVYTFLVNCFLQHPINYEDVAQNINQLSFKSWVGRIGLLKAVLWKGAKDYVAQNNEIFQGVYRILSDAWYVGVKLNFADTNIKLNYLETIDFITKETSEQVASLIKNQSDIDSLFSYARNWLQTTDLTTSIGFKNENEVQCFGEFSYWVVYLKSEVDVSFNEREFDQIIENCSLETISTALLGLYSMDQLKHNHYKEVFLTKLRADFRIPSFEIDHEKIKLHFLIDVESDISDDATAHKRAIRIINLVRKALPYLQMYSTQGYGHRILKINPVDESSKNIPISALPLSDVVRINVWIINLFEFNFRPDGWRDYIVKVHRHRQSTINVLKDFNRSMGTYFQKNNPQVLLDLILRINTDELKAPEIPFPKNISDPTGSISERSRIGEQDDNPDSHWLRRLQEYQKAYGAYASSLSNAMSQSFEALTIIITGKTRSEQKEWLALHNAQEARKKLNEFHNLFNTHFSKFTETSELQKMESNEIDNLDTYIGIWRYVMANVRLSGNLERKLRTESKRIVDDFVLRLRACLKKAGKENDYSCKLIQAPSLDGSYIIIDVNTPLRILEAVQSTSKAIYSAVGHTSFKTQKGFMLEMNYPQFTLIPVVYGRAISRGGFQLSINSFRVNEFSGLNSLQYIQTPIDRSFFIEQNIDVYEDYYPGIATLNNFMEKCSTFSVHIAQIASLGNLPEQISDDVGRDILEQYTSRSRLAAYEAYSVILNYLAFHIKDYSSLKDYSTLTAEDREFISVLNDVLQQLLPSESDNIEEEIRERMSISELEEWSKKLDTISTKFLIIYYFTLKKEIFGLWNTQVTTSSFIQ